MNNQHQQYLHIQQLGMVEACIIYCEKTHPDYSQLQLEESVISMLELIGMEEDSIAYWISEYFYNS